MKIHETCKEPAARIEELRILNRIAVEELEAWFFGDPDAIMAVYPRVHLKELQKKSKNPDSIVQTWEALERILQQAGYYPQGLQKIKNAELISEKMDITKNGSKSFCNFRDEVQALVSQ